MNLLVTGAWPEGKKHRSELIAFGHEVQFLQYEKDALPCPYDWVEGVICNGLFLHHDIEKFSNLNYIQLTSAGYDRVPLDYVQKRGIRLYNAKGVYSVPMAEFAMFSVLQFYKQGSFFSNNQAKGIWEKNRTLRELTDKTVCIVGCGSVGMECAKRFAAFGCKIIGLDVSRQTKEQFAFIEPIEKLDDFIPYSDVVVLTLPLTEETKHLFSKERVRALKPGCVFVNIARGSLVDTNALIERLQQNDICAALDVFEEEPLSENSLLWKMQNVMITPHNSFVGENNDRRLSDLIFKNLKEQ